jgi:hypothetical protein
MQVRGMASLRLPYAQAGLAPRGPLRLRESMTTPKPESPPRTAKKASRAERLAAELRANLRRRKAQARARNAAEKPSSGEK